jgi:hypothetical protein
LCDVAGWLGVQPDWIQRSSWSGDDDRLEVLARRGHRAVLGPVEAGDEIEDVALQRIVPRLPDGVEGLEGRPIELTPEAWLVLDRGGSTACKIDPGFEVDLVVMGDNREMHRWLLGWRSFRELQQSGDVRFVGPTRLGRAFSSWFGQALFASSFRPKQQAVTAS